MFGPSNNRGVHLQLEFDCAFDGCNCVDLLSDVCRDIAARDEHRLAGTCRSFLVPWHVKNRLKPVSENG
jgi:hypothetical protein